MSSSQYNYNPHSGIIAKDVIRSGEIIFDYNHNSTMVLRSEMYSDSSGCMVVSNNYAFKVGDWIKITDDLIIEIKSIKQVASYYHCDFDIVINRYSVLHDSIKFPIQGTKVEKSILDKPLIMETIKEVIEEVIIEKDTKYGKLNYHVDWDKINTWCQIPF